MTAAPWLIALAIVVGSAGGALLRQSIVLVCARSQDPISPLMLAASVIVGGLLGTAMGAVMNTQLLVQRQDLLLAGLVAALGTFGAAAALGGPERPPRTGRYLWRAAATHIALTIFAALAGILLIETIA